MDNFHTNAPVTIADRTPIGLVTIGRTTYRVYSLRVGPNASNYGVRHNFALEGPRGAQFMVTDHGPKYRLNAFRVGHNVAPRELRGVTREHFAAFGVEV